MNRSLSAIAAMLTLGAAAMPAPPAPRPGKRQATPAAKKPFESKIKRKKRQGKPLFRP